MKLKNTSEETQHVLPHTGPSFTCAPGAVVDVADVCGEELVRDMPDVWASADDVKPKKSKKDGAK